MLLQHLDRGGDSGPFSAFAFLVLVILPLLETPMVNEWLHIDSYDHGINAVDINCCM